MKSVPIPMNVFKDILAVCDRADNRNDGVGTFLGIAKRYLTPREAAEYTGIPYKTLIGWYYEGVGPRPVDLPSFPDQGDWPEPDNWRYDIHDLDAFMELMKFHTEMPDLDIIHVNMEITAHNAAAAAREVEESKIGGTSASRCKGCEYDELRAFLASLCSLPLFLGRIAAPPLAAMLDQVTRFAKGVLF